MTSGMPGPAQYRSPTMRDVAQAADAARLRELDQPKRHEGEGALSRLTLRRCRVVSQHNDYLTCKQFDGTNNVGPDLLVAKPYKLRHVLGHYEGLTALTTVAAGQVTAEDGSGEEAWVVTPSYQAGDEIYAAAVATTGVVVATVDLRLIDVNVDGRAWAEEASS